MDLRLRCRFWRREASFFSLYNLFDKPQRYGRLLKPTSWETEPLQLLWSNYLRRLRSPARRTRTPLLTKRRSETKSSISLLLSGTDLSIAWVRRKIHKRLLHQNYTKTSLFIFRVKLQRSRMCKTEYSISRFFGYLKSVNKGTEQLIHRNGLLGSS